MSKIDAEDVGKEGQAEVEAREARWQAIQWAKVPSSQMEPSHLHPVLTWMSEQNKWRANHYTFSLDYLFFSYTWSEDLHN